MTRIGIIVSLVGGALALTASGLQAQTGHGTVTVAQSEEHGAYLADAQGRALYMFEADTQGQGDQTAVSNCYDDCAQAWPPLLTQGEPEAGEQANADLLDTIERRDGTMQVTYNGWPLYYFVRDEEPGQTRGHDVEGFGGEWYLLTPQGEIMGHEHE